MAFNITSAISVKRKSDNRNRTPSLSRSRLPIVKFDGIEPYLVIDGVSYPIPFTFDIYNKVTYILSNTVNNKYPPYTIFKCSQSNDETGFNITRKYWTYVKDGMRVNVIKVKNGYEVDIDKLNVTILDIQQSLKSKKAL